MYFKVSNLGFNLLDHRTHAIMPCYYIIWENHMVNPAATACSYPLRERAASARITYTCNIFYTVWSIAMSGQFENVGPTCIKPLTLVQLVLFCLSMDELKHRLKLITISRVLQPRNEGDMAKSQCSFNSECKHMLLK